MFYLYGGNSLYSLLTEQTLATADVSATNLSRQLSSIENVSV